MPGPFELLIIGAMVLVPLGIIAVVLLAASSKGKASGHHPNLTPCPDCGRQVSPQAEACPNCGRPVQG